MYKAIILNKIRSVKEKRLLEENINIAVIPRKYCIMFLLNNLKGVDSAYGTSGCKGCKETGHFTKAYFICKLYKQTNADDGMCSCFERVLHPFTLFFLMSLYQSWDVQQET